MEEVRAVPPNGYSVASTFSGCGGSCLGFKMAGFRHVYANEFVPAARETYAANFPDVRLDDRDIRKVSPEDVLAGTGLRPGDLDVLEGSPPCASFSTAGKRSRGWGKVKKYSDVEQRTDDLFFEFARLLRGLAPRTFVAENVSGLVKGVAKGYFLEILRELKACGYVVSCRVLDAQWLGVPQQRARTIFVGVREDLGVAPAHPAPLPYRYSIRDALPWIGGVTHDTSGNYSKGRLDVDVDVIPAVTVGVGGMNSLHFKVEDRGRKSQRFSTGFRGGEGVSDAAPLPTIMADGLGGSSHSQYSFDAPPPPEEAIVKTARRPSFKGSMSRGRRPDEPSFAITATGMEGMSQGEVAQRGPLPPGTSPESIERFAIGKEWKKLKPGQQSERYFNLVRPDADAPVPTITQTGGVLGAASVTHPSEPRKFTMLELRRLGGFPDDFVLTGTYRQQWERIGRAVPPVMMAHVARTLRDEVLARCPRKP